MSGQSFFDNPILNSPYEYPCRHWEMDADNKPTGKVIERRRKSSNRTPIAAPKTKGASEHGIQGDLFNDVVSDVAYRENELINSIRAEVAAWRNAPEPVWGVTAETARLLKHWRHYDFPSYKPFFCQIEAIETLIWLVEVAPTDKIGKQFLAKIQDANTESDPNLYRIALKLATGAGKTTVMAMIIAWQTINANRHGVGDKFTNGFLITTPGITIRDRLRVLLPNDPEAYYSKRQLVPMDLMPLMNSARIVITNYHAYELRNTLDLSAGTKAMLAGPLGAGPQTTETPGQMLQRVMKDLVGLKNVLMINDEAHHCYRHRPDDGKEDEERPLDSEEKDDAKRNADVARVWIRGLETVRAHIGSERMRPKVIDLSATPFFLRGSGYQEGTLFPWTVCDFSLMDALECGIVKLPRIPIDDNLSPISELPKYRELWKNICEQDKSFRSLRGKGKGGAYDPQNIPNLLQTAIRVLYKGYEDTYNRWMEAGIKTPPCFIFVCQNTTISKLVYDFVSGYVTTDKDGDERTVPAACSLFSNYDASGQLLARPNTLLIDSTQLESGEALTPEFRMAASKEIETFKRELIARSGDRQAADKLDDAALLREVMNTVGKEGALGGNVRCVVSVAMLTEGWDANNVTHILGVRAFGTQLLCEQVVGRALRRLNYEADASGRYRAEYADIFGIPFDFASGTVNPKPIEPPDFVHVHAVHPERDHLAIHFPRVVGYYLDQTGGHIRLTAKFNEMSEQQITPNDIGPTAVLNSAFVGRREKLVLGEGTMRMSDVIYHLAKHFIGLYFMHEKFTDMDRTQLFIQVRQLFAQWVNGGYLKLDPTVNAESVVVYKNLADAACQRLNMAIMRSEYEKGNSNVRAIIDNFMPTGSTSRVNFRISRTSKLLFETTASHVNYAVCDSAWEAVLCRVLEEHPKTLAYVKNFNLGFEVPYVFGTENRIYLPDFIVLVDDGHGKDDPLHLIVEVKGYRYADANIKKQTMQDMWIPGVNAEKSFGRWAFVELNEKDFTLDGFKSDEALLENCRAAYANALEQQTKGVQS